MLRVFFISAALLMSLQACGKAPTAMTFPAKAPLPAGTDDVKEEPAGPQDPPMDPPPVDPANPDTPTGPDKPVDPTKPEEPQKPDPEKPVDPVKPDPEKPVDPVKPNPDSCMGVVDACPVEGGITWNCKKRFLYGMNYAWHQFSADFGGNTGHNIKGITGQVDAVEKELVEMKNYGSNVIRWWIFPDFRGNGVTFDGNGTPTGLGGTFEADLLKALELAEKHDLYYMLTLFSFDAFKPSRNDGGAYIRSIRPMVVDAAKRSALMEKVIRPMIKIAEKSPYKKRLMTWEPINEPEWAMLGKSKHGDPDYECNGATFECVSHDQMEVFLSDIVKVIRAESKALVSIGGAAIKWKNAWIKVDQDYYQYHIYDWVNAYFPYTRSVKEWGITDKPVVMGEFPLQGVTGADSSKLLDSWYANGFGGAMGWALTDPAFDWTKYRDPIKTFAGKHSCQTKF